MLERHCTRQCATTVKNLETFSKRLERDFEIISSILYQHTSVLLRQPAGVPELKLKELHMQRDFCKGFFVRGRVVERGSEKA